MSKFEHDLILRTIKTVDAVVITIPFAICWFLYYANRVDAPFYKMGNWVVIALFFALYIIFGRIYDAFLMSMNRISEIIYSQTLAAIMSDGVLYIVICLLSKHLSNILPIIAALVAQILLAVMWAFSANHWYFHTFKPQPTAIIYEVHKGMLDLINDCSLKDKYNVKKIANSKECLLNIKMLDGIKTVF